MSDKKKKRFVLTPVCRCSFPDIVDKNEMSEKFQITMMLDKDCDLTEMKEMARAARLKKWPNALPKGFLNPFMKVDDMDKDDKYDGYEDGMIIVRAKAQYRPGVVDAKKNPIDLEDMDTYLYGGCYIRVAVSAYAYAHKSGNKGVAFGMDAVQVVKDGEPLGSRVSAEEAFADVEDVEYEEAGVDAVETDEFDL